MDLMQAIVLGLVQGLSEFIPISSSAHLIIVPWLLGWNDPGIAFDVALHMGTLVAVLVYFWRDWVRLIRRRADARHDASGSDRRSGRAAGAGSSCWRRFPARWPGVLGESKLDEMFHGATAGRRGERHPDHRRGDDRAGRAALGGRAPAPAISTT